jgi:hypothetical protein
MIQNEVLKYRLVRFNPKYFTFKVILKEYIKKMPEKVIENQEI